MQKDVLIMAIAQVHKDPMVYVMPAMEHLVMY